jgi:hypothetical protein
MFRRMLPCTGSIARKPLPLALRNCGHAMSGERNEFIESRIRVQRLEFGVCLQTFNIQVQ